MLHVLMTMHDQTHIKFERNKVMISYIHHTYIRNEEDR